MVVAFDCFPAHIGCWKCHFFRACALSFPALHLSWQRKGGIQNAASKSTVEVLPPGQRWSQLLTHTFKTLRSPEIWTHGSMPVSRRKAKGRGGRCWQTFPPRAWFWNVFSWQVLPWPGYLACEMWLGTGLWQRRLCVRVLPARPRTGQGWGGKALEKICGEESKKLWQDCRKGPLVVLVGDRCQTDLQVGVGSWKPSVTTEVSWNLVTFLIPKPLVALLSPDPKIRGVFVMGLISPKLWQFHWKCSVLGSRF